MMVLWRLIVEDFAPKEEIIHIAGEVFVNLDSEHQMPTILLKLRNSTQVVIQQHAL